MVTTLAIILGKLIARVSRTLNFGGGSAAPGLYALKIDPKLIEKLSAKIPHNIVITGTNGKTTTAKMLAHLAKNNGLKVIRNSTGSNLERGIASTLLTFKGRADLGIWELDEAAFNTVAPKLKPEIVAFLNISRDQLDRYGELDKVVNNWATTVSLLNPETIVLINEDDKHLSKLKNHFKGKVEKFGRKNIKHLQTKGLIGSNFQFTINNKLLTINLPIPGLYHVYDAVAALVIAHYLTLRTHTFKDFQPAFGRFEKLPFGFIFLIKNPAGATGVFETIANQLKPKDRLLIALNDNLADGRDVSWIWDANFEVLLQNSSRAKSRDLYIICSGKRATDMAVRLKYAGFDPNTISVEVDPKKALKQAREGLKGKLYILPTYTALLQLQRILAKMGIKEHYWKEI